MCTISIYIYTSSIAIIVSCVLKNIQWNVEKKKTLWGDYISCCLSFPLPLHRVMKVECRKKKTLWGDYKFSIAVYFVEKLVVLFMEVVWKL